MSYIYVASPYSHPDPAVRQERFEQVCKFTAWCFSRGLEVYSPVAYTHLIQGQYNIPWQSKFWDGFSLTMLRPARSMIVLQLDGWEHSLGVSLELTECLETSKPVSYMHMREIT